MRTVIILPFFHLHVYTSDSSPDIAKQQIAMEQALFTPANIDRGIWEYLFREEADRTDARRWRGVETSGSTITEFVMTSPSNHMPIYSVTLAWLPHTIKKLFLGPVNLIEDFDCRDLPRELRYCYVQAQFVRYIGTNEFPSKLSLSDLPRHLEHFYLHSEHPLCQTTEIFDLPPNISCIMIWSRQMQRVVVDNDALPQSLQEIVFWRGGDDGALQRISARGGKVDKRVRAGKGGYVHPENWEYFKKRCAQIYKETKDINP